MKNVKDFGWKCIIRSLGLGLLLIISNNIFSQKDTLHINDIYSNPSNYLVLEKIIKVDSTSKQELINRFENWGGSNFRDYSNVRTSKTDDQITLLYIVEATSSKMYVILKAEFKDNKVRITFSDDGNVATQGTYIGSTYHPGIPSRSYRFIGYFEDNMLIYKVNGGSFNINTIRAKNVISYKSAIDRTILEIEKSLELKSTSSIKSDW
jgi:hypothetical protein